ncbi:hypothetical protein ABMY20_09955 [Tenacibaculum sp. SSH1-16]|uniref:hypothetical protein n=1 Tax=Tenacibaculum sp. SSH1-16 TaxID=3136667 RepID=UPI0032C4A465
MLSKRIILQFIIMFFSAVNASGQSYKLFNTSRNFWSKNFCERNPPTGNQYTTLNAISVKYGLKGDGSTLYVDDSNGIRKPDEYYYNLEEMLLGIVGTDNVSGYPEPVLLDISNICYNDFIHYLTISPSYFNTELTTPATENNGDNSTGSEVTLSATSGYHPLVYTWQYYVDFTPEEMKLFPENATIAKKNKINGRFNPYDKGDFSTSSSWRNFPNQLLGKDKVTFTAKDLFGKYANLFVGRSIKFRIRMSNGWTSDKIFSFVFIPSSPKLKKVVEDNATCNYSKDGTFRLELNRDLAEDEYLVVSLFFKDETNLDEGFSLYKQQDTSTLVKIDNNYTYTWDYSQDPLPSQTYKIKYQTYKGAEGIPDESSWASLKFSNEFTIQKATNVDFTAKRVNDESCFEAGDGKIQVEVTSGETGRLYFYILYKIEGTTEIVERGWTSFSGTTTIISGLGKGKYKIKVKDSEGCLAK